MNKKIIRAISWILLFFFINQCYGVKSKAYDLTDGSWVIISRDLAYPIDNNKLIIEDAAVITTGNDLKDVIINLITSGKTHIYIKDGNYNLNGTLDINNQGVIILGESNNNTKIKQILNTVSIKINANNIQVTNLSIDGTAGTVVFHAKNVDNIRLEDCIIYGSNTDSAVAFYGDNSTKSKNNYIIGNEIYSQLSGINKDGIIVYNQKNANVLNNSLTGSRIGLNLCEESNIINNTIEDSESGGIRATIPAANITISGNTIKNVKDGGITVVKENSSDSNSIRFDGLEITNNNIDNSKYFGIEISNLKNAIISNNTVNNIDFEGIYLLYSDNISVKNNTISNCGLYNVGGGKWPSYLNSSIFFDTEVKNSDVENNKISNVAICPYAIRIQPGISTGNTDNTITNNIITGEFNEGISASEVSPENNIITTSIPLNIVTSVADNNIILSWDEILGITDYEVEVDGSLTIISVSNTSYTHNGLALNSNHKYRVRMKYGQWSSEVSATTLSIPKNIITSATDNSIKVEWDGVANATGYIIEVDGSLVDVGLNNNYNHINLLGNSTHKYKVKTKNGQWSNEVTETTLPQTIVTTPSAVGLVPQNITTTSTTPSSIQIKWDEVSGATGYEIELDGKVVVDVGIDREYTHTGLASKSTHNYRVRTKGGQWSNIVTAITSKSKSQSNRHKDNKNTSNEYSKTEIIFTDKKTILYKEQLIQDTEEDKLKRMVLYIFGEQYYLGIKTWRNNQIELDTQFKIDVIPDNLFSDSEIRSISLDKNDSIDTILVHDMKNYSEVIIDQGNNYLSEYSIVDTYTFSVENSEIHLQKNKKYIERIK